jgi:hypothetical protein
VAWSVEAVAVGDDHGLQPVSHAELGEDLGDM